MTTNSKAKMSLAELYALWDKLNDTPTGYEGENLDCLEEAFLGFGIGTYREQVWHWFEKQHPGFIVGNVLQGIRRTDAPVCEAARLNPTPKALAVDTSHWAYLQGRASGLTGDSAERGIMAFGLGCAVDADTVRSTRLWLAGFDAGIAEANVAARNPPQTRVDDGTRQYGQEGPA